MNSQVELILRPISSLAKEAARRFSTERARGAYFIYARLAASALAMALTPFYLFFFGAPDLWAATAFVWLILPLAAIFHVAHTGRLNEAQSISLASLLILTAIVGIGVGTSREIVFAWALLAPLEAAISGSAALLVAACFFVLTMLCGVAGAQYWGLLETSRALPAGAAIALCAPAALYAAVLTIAALDIHKMRVRIEEASRANYRVLADAIGDLVLRHDQTGAVLSASSSAESVVGAPAQELVGRGFFERIHLADRSLFLQTIADSLRCDETIATTFRLRIGPRDSENPAFAWVEMRARRFAGAAGPCDLDGAAIVSVVRDITRAKTYEDNLRAARAEAEYANSWKDRLLANVSHELRTPLNAIIGFSEILSSPAMAPRDVQRQIEYAGIIHASAEHLLSVVNLVLDASKIEAGQFELAPESFDVDTLIDACCDMLRLKADKGRVELVRSPVAGATELIADKRAFRQIVLNLLSNAVKFTPPGGRVTVGAEAENGTLALFVEDTGIGVAQGHFERLGDPFFQVRASHDRPFEGTGLGLSVVRGLVGLHGGAISVESAAGHGMRVRVRLPRDCRPTARSDAPPARIEASAPPDPSPTTKEKRIA
ncbi:MAG TPA: PAS domain-containing sensor histidine kinase [Roseiarcus sp.]|nr:PAS domain-containing sensor histidine kinase [Roseiarcus sp.]